MATNKALYNMTSIKDLAELKGVTPNTIRRWIKAKQLPEPQCQIGNMSCWYTPHLNQWFAKQAAAALRGAK